MFHVIATTPSGDAAEQLRVMSSPLNTPTSAVMFTMTGVDSGKIDRKEYGWRGGGEGGGGYKGRGRGGRE